MPVARHHPDTLFDSRQFGFTQAISSEGGRTVWCAGQTAWDKDLNIIGRGDLGKQMHAALDNVARALAAAGAGLGDVVQLRIYVVNYDPSMIETIAGALKDRFGDAAPANTLIGVQALAMPEFLVELEATAVV